MKGVTPRLQRNAVLRVKTQILFIKSSFTSIKTCKGLVYFQYKFSVV